MPQSSAAVSSFGSKVFHILLLALCYACIGRLSVLLAIPPGYATAIFPPAGIALVVMLLFGRYCAPGIFLGSLLLNLWIGFDSGSDIVAGLPIAFGAATGATLQALLALYLVRRYVTAPDELIRDTDIILFLLLAGPLACVVNASFGVSSLYYAGALNSAGIAYAWVTWWVGDSLGVLVSAPLLFILLAPGRGVWRQRRWAVGLPLVMLSVGLMWMFITFSSWEVRQRQFEFNEDVNITHEQLGSRLERTVLALGALERFFSYSANVSRGEFKGYADFFLSSSSDDDVRGLSWNRYLRQSQRSEFEQTLQQDVGQPFIFDFTAQREKQRSAEAEHYVVVEYIEPLAGNEAVIGLNILSNPVRLAAIFSALDSGQLSVSEKINLLQSNEDAVLLFFPVYSVPALDEAQRREHIAGFVTAVLAFKPLIENLLTEKDSSMLEMRLTDVSNNNALLYQTAALPQSTPLQLEQSLNITVGGRQWQAQYWLSAEYKSLNSDFLAFYVLTIGLLFTSILGAFLLVVTGRAHYIGQLVTKRSAELKGVLDNAIDAILTFDSKGNIESVNPAGEKLTQYPATQLINKSVQMILPKLELDPLVESELHNSPLNARFDSTVMRQDTAAIPVEVALSKMEFNGESRFTVILRDLTERHEAEKIKDDIISTVSHELRTPLTSIMGSLGLVSSGVTGPLPQKAAELVSLAMQNSQRLTMLVNDILELSKHQTENYQLAQEPIALETFLTKAINLNAGYASQYDVKLVLQQVPTDMVISGDEVKLMQVMANLLSNAIKYSPRHGCVTVFTAISAPQFVDIAVQDQGNGIPLAFQQQVFQRFSQADSTDTRRVGGTGLGLAIAKIIVEKHQGKIWFETVEGKGCTFFIRLPLYQHVAAMPLPG
ncbi:CHASE domain-containing protein [Rheinheimera maricola]|uniref:histidine kinase n=1 Tax=Rheinheimera maricola TaxID=2793282 RepID=A0ABS7XAX1_9GAMM|nr:CHASE domain-containing protein [Rheinheimera maricola]MBZ9611863.1 CHASE domain-containing protein [Rheinheimera maricola]